MRHDRSARSLTLALALALAVALGAGVLPVRAAPGGKRDLVERSARKRPEWIVRPPESDRFFYSAGFATGVATLAEAKTEAALDAVEDVVLYLGLHASTRYEERRTALATDVLSMIESSGSAHIASGRAADLYFERYREPGPAGPRYVYDVYLLLRVPMDEIEIERGRILADRARATAEAEAALAEVSPQALARDFVGSLSRLAAAYRQVQDTGSSALLRRRLESLMGELAARLSLNVVGAEPSTDGHRLRATAAMISASGPVPIGNLPLVFEATQGARKTEATGVTDGSGAAEAVAAFPVDPLRRALVRVRLAPSSLPGEQDDADEPPRLRMALAGFGEIEAYQMVHVRFPSLTAAAAPLPLTAPTPVAQVDPRPVEIRAGRETFLDGTSTLVRPFLVRLTAPPPSLGSRPPLNLALVIDLSDSMAEPGKLDRVKKVASLVVRHLGQEDVISVVTYASATDVVVPAQSVAGRQWILHRLDRLRVGGAGNLGGGLRAALEQLSPHIRPDSTTRLIVLTDGVTDTSVTEPAGLLHLAETAGTQAAVTIVGVGRDTDPAALRVIARHAGGRYYHAAKVGSLPGIISREIRGLLDVSLSDIRIELDLTGEARLRSAHGQTVQITQGRLEVLVDPLPPGETHSVLLDLKIECGEPGATRLGAVRVKYRDRSLWNREYGVAEELGAYCSRDVLFMDDVLDPYVDLFARLTRGTSTLKLALKTWDPYVLEDMETFLVNEEPSIRAEVEALGDAEMLDMLRFIELGSEEMWAGVTDRARRWEVERRKMRGDASYLTPLPPEEQDRRRYARPTRH